MAKSLRKAFAQAKYAAGVVKDTFANIYDSIMAGQELMGRTQNGEKVDRDQLFADSAARNKARRTARKASKKNNPI